MRARGLGVAFVALLALPLLGVRCDRDPTALEATYATPPSKFVTVPGPLRIHYRDRGEGPPVVLVHGSNASLFTWEGWAARLATHHRVLTLDMPGHGLTGPDPERRYSPSAMAEVLDAFATQVGLTRFSVAGNSMGGNVAWHYALAHGDRLDRLVLVDAAGLPRREPRPLAFRLFASPWLGHFAQWLTPRFMVERTVREIYADPTRLRPEVVDRTQALLLRAGNREATRERAALGDDGLWKNLGAIRTPTLIVWGAEDRWIRRAYADEFHAAITGSKLVVLDGLGHVPMEEDPEQSLRPVEAFLDGAPAL